VASLGDKSVGSLITIGQVKNNHSYSNRPSKTEYIPRGLGTAEPPEIRIGVAFACRSSSCKRVWISSNVAAETGSVASLYPQVAPLATHGEHVGRWPSQRVFLALHTLQDSATLRRLGDLLLDITRDTTEALEVVRGCTSIDCRRRVWFRVC
jgi:hypothetical protein